MFERAIGFIYNLTERTGDRETGDGLTYTQYIALLALECTVYTVQCKLYTVNCALYTVHCSMYSAQCTVNRLQNFEFRYQSQY